MEIIHELKLVKLSGIRRNMWKKKLMILKQTEQKYQRLM